MRKFRPSFTLPELEKIHEMCSNHGSQGTVVESVRSNVADFILRAKLGAVKASHTAQKLEERLGMEKPDSPRESAYNKFIQFPSLCSATEILDARTFMYENDMMDPEEEAIFESTMFGENNGQG